jgi:putative membrane protein
MHERLAHALLKRRDILKENPVTTRRLAIALAPLACLVLAEPAFAQNPKTDMQFATTAARGGQAEIQLGQMAATKAASADVKAFGQKMVTDHKKADEELDAAARADGETIPKGLEPEHKADAARFDKLSGAAFDKAYMKQMVEDHRKTIALFEKEAASGKDSHVKQFAQATLPTLREHLKMAEELQSRTDKASAESSK